jgi:hypothetical protein
MYLCMYIYSMNTYALTWAALLCSGALKGRLSTFSLSYLKIMEQSECAYQHTYWKRVSLWCGCVGEAHAKMC